MTRNERRRRRRVLSFMAAVVFLLALWGWALALVLALGGPSRLAARHVLAAVPFATTRRFAPRGANIKRRWQSIKPSWRSVGGRRTIMKRPEADVTTGRR